MATKTYGILPLTERHFPDFTPPTAKKRLYLIGIAQYVVREKTAWAKILEKNEDIGAVSFKILKY